ncbi:NXPE family member 1-like [Amphiura filiformis]|uniref:NXPE family member 1-like n=1 Tax=Amphiura filiformis TaxID=82378 RepID=UPI003B219718
MEDRKRYGFLGNHGGIHRRFDGATEGTHQNAAMEDSDILKKRTSRNLQMAGLQMHEDHMGHKGNDTNVNKDKVQTLLSENTTEIIEMDDTGMSYIHFTSAKKSTYQLLNQPIRGSYLHIHMQVRDEDGHPRTVGGDFWLATLISNSNAHQGEPNQINAGTAGKIIDHKNGTYSVYFYLGWTGKAEININLVHSNDANSFLRNTYWRTGGKPIWNGYFVRNEGGEEVVACRIRHSLELRNGTRDCEFWFPQAMGQTVFACHNPHPSISCAAFDRIKYNFDATMRVTRDIAGSLIDMFEGNKFASRLENGVRVIDVLPGTNDVQYLTPTIFKSRPLCKPTEISNQLKHLRLSTGFWSNGNWTSLLCQATHWRNQDAIGTCLRNRELTLSAGDLKSHQWAVYLTSVLLGIAVQNDDKELKMHQYFPFYNFTLKLINHPFIQTESSRHFNDVIHTVQILEEKGRSCADDIIIISPWEHFLQWTRESYREHLLLIRIAIEKYLHKCPNKPVIVRGPHPGHAVTLEERIAKSNYTAYEWGELMRATFAGSGAWYLDVWEMNLSFPGAKIDVYTPYAVIRQEVDMLLSYICRSEIKV